MLEYFSMKYFSKFPLDFGVRMRPVLLDLPWCKFSELIFCTFNQESVSCVIVVFLDVNIGVFKLLLYYNHASDIVPCVSKIHFQL